MFPSKLFMKRIFLSLPFVIGICALAFFGRAAISQNDSGVTPVGHDDVQTCLGCHSPSAKIGPPVNHDALAISPHKDLKCQDCHTSMTGFPHTASMLKQKATCGSCHTQEFEDYSMSVHARPDKVAGDHPNCITCHGNGDPHAITRPSAWTRPQIVQLCSSCHAQKARMGRYNVDPDAVSSYDDSFHGKALLHFGMMKAAICTDCHKNHDVLSPNDPRAPTNRLHAASTCGQPGCHPGAKINFAMSGANHLRLKIKQSAVLRIESDFFKWLTIGTILFLLGGVALDLINKVLRRDALPPGRRLPAFTVSLSFLFVVIALLMAFLGIRHAVWSALAAIVLLIIAVMIYFFSRKAFTEKQGETIYQRFTLIQRIQHACLAVSFTVLVITGLPLRFADVHWLHYADVIWGGLAGARIAHRCAAVLMIFTWIWHTLFLMYRWHKAGYSWKSWSMWPTWKDFQDFVQISRFYLGIDKNPPKYDRFQFREKFDYFAVYWGMPIMVFSGLVLWFPIYFGNRLPEIGLSFAYIAHSDEAILAFLAIALWHFYNTHLNPDHFPMSKVYLTGNMTRSEMERDHPLELQEREKSISIQSEPKVEEIPTKDEAPPES
jgi:cytochrome b subunit of formate dehydrogenase